VLRVPSSRDDGDDTAPATAVSQKTLRPEPTTTLPRLSERLSKALVTINSPSEQNPQAMIQAAEFLIACARCEEAEVGLRRSEELLRQRGMRFAGLYTMDRVNRHFRAAHVRQKVAGLGEFGTRLFSSDEQTVLWTAPGARRLLVIFGSMFGDFWLTYPVLHALLPSERVAILYLKDPAIMMFLSGLKNFGEGEGFAALCNGILGVAREQAIDDIRIAGFSSGAYGGLLAATRIGASSYLGLSGRTDLDPRSALPQDRYVTRADLRAAAGSLMIDLKPLVAQSTHPRRGILYYGGRSRIDEAHARHFAGLPNFSVNRLLDSHHNTVMHLIADGRFESVMRKFLS
jgi:hypothetical protein